MQKLLKVHPNEPCYWISEQVVQAPMTGTMVRIQHVVVNRDGELAMSSVPLEGGTTAPGLEFECGGAMNVAKAQDIAESIRMRKRSEPDTLKINLNGETYIETDHPALEGIPLGNSHPDSRT